MDLVKIGFQINANGLKDANTEVDKLLDKVDNISTKGKKASSDFESSQKKVADSLGKTKKGTEDVLGAQNKQIDAYKKLLNLEQTRAKYISQGFGKTDATRISRMEISGADSTTLNNYKRAIEETNKAAQALRPSFEKVTESHNKFLDQVKGIAIYAALSAAIYGVMTAMTNLAVATVKMADEYTSIQNRMKLYITDAKELGKVNSQLAQFSIENNVGLRETATLFSRLAPSMQKLGANTAAITTVVDAFGKSMRIGGATAQEAASATIQFSQAMASGKLAGDEFRSISEASPRFLQAIAEGSGIAAEKLKEMSAAGMLTTEVISKALLNEYPKLIEENKKLGITLEQGANALKTGFLVAFGEFNEGAGITKALGESMANLAQSMFTAAQGARQFGADINKWFKDNANTINTVIEGFKVLASVVAAKYIVSVVAAIGSTAILTWNFVSLSAAIAGMSRTAFLGATALTALGNAAKGVALSTGGIVGLLTTVASAALIYTAFRDNAAEANAKLVEQSDIVRTTKEEVEALTNAQKENLKVKTIIDMKEANKNIDEAEAKYLSMMDVLTGKSFGNTLPSSAEKLISQAANGTKAFDDVTVSLLNMGVISEKSAKQLFDQTSVIVTAKQEALKYGTNARLLGIDLEIAGNKAHNATPAIAGFKSEVRGVGDEADIAGGKVRKFYQDLQTDTKKNILAFELTTKLNISPSTGNKVAEELSNRAAQEEGLKNKELINQKQKLVKLGVDLLAQNAGFQKGAKSSEELDQLKANTAEVLKQQRIYDNMRKSKPYVKVNPSSLLTPEETKIIKAYDASASLSSNQKKAEKDADKSANKKRKDKAKYTDQVKELQMYINLLTQAEDVEVARIASEKEYQNAFGTNLEQAKELKELKRQSDQIEARAEYMKSLSEEAEAQGRLVELMKLGLNIEEAKALVQAKFTNNAKGKIAAELQLTNAAYEQHYALASQISDQEAINALLAQGYSLASATFRIRSAKVRGLSGKQTDLDDLDAAYDKQLKQADASAAVQETLIKINDLNREGALLAKALSEGYTRSNLAAAALAGSTKGMSPHLATSLLIKQDSVAIDKERAQNAVQMLSYLEGENEILRDIKNTYATIKPEKAKQLETERKHLKLLEDYTAKKEEQKKTPLGDFSTVNFDAFGDFGNPFKDALAGLNEFMAGNTKLNESLGIVQTNLEALRSKAFVEDMFGNANEVTKINNEIAGQVELEQSLQSEKAKTQDLAYVQGIKFAKSFFKEESKGYKALTTLEQVQQGIRIALAIEEAAVKIGLVETTTLATMAANAKQQISEGVTAAISSMKGLPFPYNIAAMGATIAAIAGLGVAIGGGFDSSSGTVTPANDGTGTVFGDSEAQSASIANSIDLLSENSDLMLPLTSAMLRSLKNIESNIGGVTNLILRGGLGGDFSSLEFDGKLTGVVGAFGKVYTDSAKTMMNVLTLGLDKLLLGGALGNLVGGIASTVLGGLFGKTSQEVVASGLYAGNQKLSDILSNGINLRQYADVKTTKKSWFSSSSSTKTKYSSVDDEIKQQFTLIFRGFYDSILSATNILGADLSAVENNLKNAVVSIGKINLKGLSGEEIQEKLEAVFGAAADKLAKQAFGSLEDFQSVGEGYYETLVKVASAVEEAAYYTDRLNVTAINYTDIINKQADDLATEIIRQSYLTKVGISTIKGGMTDLVNSFDGSAEEITDFINTLEDLQEQLFMTGKSGDYLTSSMILGAGGLDGLASGLDAYFEMLSPAEQAAELTRRLTNEFAIFGKQLPSDVKAFRNLVSSIDISSEAGQKLYGQIIALAPEFNDLQDALSSANSDVNALVKSLRDLAEQARAARGETEQPRNLAYTRSQFEQASVLAMQGDIASAEKLLTLGKDLMGLSKTYSVTGSEYARDLALIQRAATVSADIQEQGLGTSISTTLTPSSGTTTTPTVNTNTTSTDAKLDALRADMITAITAVAKYTQDTANRLERWDYGDRVNVHVDQDALDKPIPVKVV